MSTMWTSKGQPHDSLGTRKLLDEGNDMMRIIRYFPYQVETNKE